MLNDPSTKLPLARIRREQEEKRTQEKAQKLNLPYVNLVSTPIDREAIVLLSEEEARQARLAVVQKVGRRLEVVVADPRTPEAVSVLKKLEQKGFDLHPFIVSESSLEKAWQIYKTYTPPKEHLKGSFKLNKDLVKDIQKKVRDIEILKKKILGRTTSETLNLIIAVAYFAKASDIHLEPQRDSVKLRYRIDGVLNDILEIKPDEYRHLLNRLKILAGLKINVHDVNQDGRFTFNLPDENGSNKDIDIRVSVLPEADGETIVMRLLGTGSVGLEIKDLGFREEAFKIIETALEEPNGLILTTGPTGSGKTTTLYSFIKKINRPEIKIITVEDPIEYQIKGITQSQINANEGYGFSQALRAIVRQDPDVILVGEIRDRDTAIMAMQAALTGHLVFSTLHTNDAAGAIPRLRDLGADEKSVTSSLKAVIAQRLVRRLCPDCKEAYRPDLAEQEAIKRELAKMRSEQLQLDLDKLYRAKGCEKCFGLGYQGRIGIFEVFKTTPELEKLTLSRATQSEILEFLLAHGFVTMKQDGYLKVLEGITSFEEVERVT